MRANSPPLDVSGLRNPPSRAYPPAHNQASRPEQTIPWQWSGSTVGARPDEIPKEQESRSHVTAIPGATGNCYCPGIFQSSFLPVLPLKQFSNPFPSARTRPSTARWRGHWTCESSGVISSPLSCIRSPRFGVPHKVSPRLAGGSRGVMRMWNTITAAFNSLYRAPGEDIRASTRFLIQGRSNLGQLPGAASITRSEILLLRARSGPVSAV